MESYELPSFKSGWRHEAPQFVKDQIDKLDYMRDDKVTTVQTIRATVYPIDHASERQIDIIYITDDGGTGFYFKELNGTEKKTYFFEAIYRLILHFTPIYSLITI